MQYHRLIFRMGIRFNALNSVQESNIIELSLHKIAVRHINLAHNLARIPSGNHNILISYLRVHASNLKRTTFLEKRPVVREDRMFGLLIPNLSVLDGDS